MSKSGLNLKRCLQIIFLAPAFEWFPQAALKIDTWLDWLLSTYIESKHNASVFFENMYHKYVYYSNFSSFGP